VFDCSRGDRSVGEADGATGQVTASQQVTGAFGDRFGERELPVDKSHQKERLKPTVQICTADRIFLAIDAANDLCKRI
jgi:hypothetical protein